jgi:predicted Zn-dependent protease
MAYYNRRRRGIPIKLILAAGIILFSVLRYFSNTEENPWTGRKQHITLNPDQEIKLGLQSAPQMAQQFGGLYPDQKLQEAVKKVGQKLVHNSIAAETPYQYNFYLLRDPNTVNAFALPVDRYSLHTDY